MRCRPSRARQRGAALVLALLVFALSMVLIVAMTRDFNRVYQQASNSFLASQSGAYLRGAEGLATLALLADDDADRKADNNRDDLQELWARETNPYPLEEGGWLLGGLEDLQGRFNLNLLRQQQQQAEGTPRFSAAQAQFVRLIQAVTESEFGEIEAMAVTRAVGDWLDEDSNLRLDGAEDDDYLGLTPAYRTANRAMASVSELRAVAGVTEELYLALEPWLTVWPEVPGKLNIHTASVTLLRSLGEDKDLTPMSASDAESLADDRADKGFADIEEFLAHPALVDKAERMSETRQLLGESSDYFLLRAQVEVADRNTQLYSVLERTNRQVNVLYRTAGKL